MFSGCVSLLVLAAATTAYGQQRVDTVRTCRDEAISRYEAACEPAESTARAIAHKCARAPVSVAEQRSLADRTEIAIHERLFSEALVALFDMRSKGLSRCLAFQRSRE